MLTLDLKALQDASLVKRTAFPTVPVTVQYELTEDGARIVPVVEVMREFGLWVKSRAVQPLPREPQSLAYEHPATFVSDTPTISPGKPVRGERPYH